MTLCTRCQHPLNSHSPDTGHCNVAGEGFVCECTDHPFWSRVSGRPLEGCWLWTGAKNNHGYGQLRIDGQLHYAHRMAWRLSYGEIPPGLFVCHQCDTPPCVRPDHLFLGTQTANMRDSSAKGRMQPGSRHWAAKLTEIDVVDIREQSRLGVLATELAVLFDVHPSTIKDILNRRTWGHVPPIVYGEEVIAYLDHVDADVREAG